MLLHEYLTASALRFPDKTALICAHSTFTYSQIARSAESVASHLQSRGLNRGDRVACYLENSAEAVVTLFGTLMAGGCCVLLDAETPLSRLRFLLEHSGSRFLVAPGSKAAALKDAGGKLSCVWTGRVEEGEEQDTYETIVSARRSFDPPSIVDLDISFIIYTSGSTGKPKGVTHTHRSVDSAVSTVNDYLSGVPEDVVLDILPLHLSYGLLQILGTVRSGGTLVLERGHATPHDILRLIREYAVTGFAGTPTIWSLLLGHASTKESQDGSLQSLRYATNAADAFPVSYVPRLRHLLPGTKIYLMHGLTECLRTSYLPPEEIRQRPGSVGRGVHNVQLWLEDEDGRRLNPGEVGELVVRGSNVMVGYWEDPEATSKVLLPGRYPWERVLHTGDLFTMDVQGYLYFVARKDEIIKSRGQKVSPIEVESVLYELDEVAECRVLGVRDETLGQSIRAEVVIKAGKEFQEKKVKAHCALHLEPYKIPTSIVMVPAIPKTAAGKTRREPV
jgi:long-chain acyl-CoA synthetase